MSTESNGGPTEASTSAGEPTADAEGPEQADIVEAEDPQSGLATPRETTKARERTRSQLAWAMVALLVAITLGGLGGWLFRDFGQDKMQSLSLILSPVVTLMGTILGFYFASDRD